MENERQDRPRPGDGGSSHEPASRVRLPGYDEPARSRGPAYDWQDYDEPARSRGPAYDWQDYDNGPAGGYYGYARDSGIRRSRRASTWTAAALIAGVAATTGYLAHAIPASNGSTSGGTTRQTTSPGTVSPSTPAVHSPVATSGGSGAGGGGDN